MTATAGREPIAIAPYLPAALIGVGLVALLVPIGLDFWHQFWVNDQNGQGPIVLAAAAYAYWRDRALFDWRSSRFERVQAGAAIGLAWLLFSAGRIQSFYQLEGAAIPLLGYGLCLLAGGRKATRHFMLINLLLIAAIPLPGSLADAVLLPLKETLSQAVVSLLAALGYPMGINGVVISVGYYQLQIADACSGLWSMVSLISIGLLYEYFIKSSTRAVTIAFLATIIPIALVTNFARVLALVLVTYHFGTAAERSIHDLAAYLEVALSLILFMAAHSLAEWVLGTSGGSHADISAA